MSYSTSLYYTFLSGICQIETRFYDYLAYFWEICQVFSGIVGAIAGVCIGVNLAIFQDIFDGSL